MEEPTDPAFAPTDTKGIAHQRTSSDRDESELRAMRLAMRLSLTFGVLMLIGKLAAYLMTGSAAILKQPARLLPSFSPHYCLRFFTSLLI